MMKFKESKISAHHNYLVNDLLTPGLVVGDPNSRHTFYLLADPVLPVENTPRLSARIMDEKGNLLLELNKNRIGNNPGKCDYQPLQGGFKILRRPNDLLLEVLTQNFPRGLLTRIKARLFDENGDLRVEPLGESIQVHGEANLVLDTPFTPPIR
ncbi:MAG: hypothetical protein PVH82_11865 [Desulfobacteraceae bacterium]|jgi:hypothetical protein